MKKAILKARIDYHLELQIKELSALFGVSKSTVIRMLCKRTIEEMQDEKGNWILPEGTHTGEDAGEAGVGKDYENNIRKVRDTSGRIDNT